MAGEKTGVKNQSVLKALDIIEYLAQSGNEPKRLQDIAKGLSMNASTVLRFLTALGERGYLQQDPVSLRYSLTMKICSISNQVSGSLHLFDVAEPFMRQVSEVFQESVCLAVEQNMEVVYIGVVQGPDQMLRTMQRIGNRAPMYCTGVGKLLLLNHSDSDITKLTEKGMTAFTKNTITTREELLKELHEVYLRGYAFDNEECEIGARCVAVPLRDYTRKVVAALSVTGTIFRLTDEKLRDNLPYLRDQAEALSRKLGYL